VLLSENDVEVNGVGVAVNENRVTAAISFVRRSRSLSAGVQT